MADLSPAAQALVDAYGNFEPANVDAMAAALHQVAWMCEFQADVLKILAIAAELENING